MSDLRLNRIERQLSAPVPAAALPEIAFAHHATVASIDATGRRRPVDPARVEAMAASISEIGLKTPITVRPGPGDSNTLRLVAGGHRLAAAKLLGWVEIPVAVEDLSDDEAALVEIDENLIRNDLSVLDRARSLAERKQIYERLHPETVHGGKRQKRPANQVANLATWSRFSKDAAKATGFSERTIQRAVALVESFTPQTIVAIRQAGLADNQAQLQALAALPGKDQATVVGLIAARAAKNVASAMIVAGLAPAKTVDPDDDAVQRFMALWSRASAKARRLIEAHIAVHKQEEQPKPTRARKGAGA